MEFEHKSVLLEEIIEYLNIRQDGIYVDGTLGGGGHSSHIAKRLSGKGRLIGIDQDGDAIAAATDRLKPFKDRVSIVRSNYRAMRQVLSGFGIERADGILLDLGVSSFQLDAPERGFTYRNEDAKNIAKHIVRERQKKRIVTAGELNAVISAAIPKKIQATGGHPAKRTYQAIRIELNHELDVLKEGLEDMIDLLNPGGRLCIITFHSLEDRIVKNVFKRNENPCVCPKEFPVCVCGNVSKGRVISRKPILPGEEEMKENKRSKSAKLRVFERR